MHCSRQGNSSSQTCTAEGAFPSSLPYRNAYKGSKQAKSLGNKSRKWFSLPLLNVNSRDTYLWKYLVPLFLILTWWSFCSTFLQLSIPCTLLVDEEKKSQYSHLSLIKFKKNVRDFSEFYQKSLKSDNDQTHLLWKAMVLFFWVLCSLAQEEVSKSHHRQEWN